eukprot:5289828-Ditylum_brightwellii.AAC.1
MDKCCQEDKIYWKAQHILVLNSFLIEAICIEYKHTYVQVLWYIIYTMTKDGKHVKWQNGVQNYQNGEPLPVLDPQIEG